MRMESEQREKGLNKRCSDESEEGRNEELRKGVVIVRCAVA